MKTYGIPLVDDFLVRKFANEGVSKPTLRTYIHVFNCFLSSPYFDFSNFDTFSEENFLRFLSENLEERSWSSNTYNNVRKNLKLFCGFLIKKGKLETNPFEKISKRIISKALPRFLTTEQIEELLRAVEKEFEINSSKCSGDNFLNIRNKTIYYTYLYSGLRLSELLNLKIDDISFGDYSIRVNHGKGNKDRIVVLLPKLEDQLKFYLKEREKRNFKSLVLFPSLHGYSLQPRDINAIHKKIRARVNFYFTTHMFRHSYATALDGQNVNVNGIAKMLGHANISTSQIYIGLNPKRMALNLRSLVLY